MSESLKTTSENISPPEQTTCCIVGGGPAGVFLALLLARQGISVTLLESHQDFEREFRGDTLHPSVLENLAQIGLAESVLALSNSTVEKLQFQTVEGSYTFADLSRLKTPFPYIAMIPQAKFLDFLVSEAQRFPNFRLLMGAKAEELIEENGVVRGVRYLADRKIHALRALLTIAADGRGSQMRLKAGLKLTKTSPPMDVVWFRLPHDTQDVLATDATLRFGSGKLLVLIDRCIYWQAGYVIIKGGYHELRKAGIESFRQELMQLIPEFQLGLESLQNWTQCAVLNVQTGRVAQWYKPGLLLIGDAAHIMSPIGGVGINYAIQDAIAAANLLTNPLRAGRLETSHLEAVQRRRQWPTKVIQGLQAYIQKSLIANALKSNQPFRLPLPIRMISRIPILQELPARIVAFGIRPEHIHHVKTIAG